MKRRYTNATVMGSLLGLSLSSAAWAGDRAKAQGDAPGPARAAIAMHIFERMDENKDGQVTRREASDASQRLFERLDLDHDGELTKQEAEAGAKMVRQQEIAARFAELDANRDGRLTPAEAQLPPAPFERLDTNRDKLLTLEELQAGADRRGEQHELRFDQADANRDGKVTRDEAEKAAAARFERIDADRDGVVTKKELEAHVAQMVNHAGKSHGGSSK